MRHGEASTFYYYDALGRRLAKVHQATATEVPQSTYYGWNGHQLSLEVTETEKVHYVYLGDSFEPVAQERTWLRPPSHWSGGPLDPNDPKYIDPDQQTQGDARGRMYYYHVDHLGTTICQASWHH